MPDFFIPVLYSILGFLLGGVLFSYHLPKLLRGVDIVALSPDHNPGTANAVKLCGLPLGLLCLALDMAKGFLPVWLAMRRLPPDTLWLAPVLLAPVLGHALAVFYPFRGGKAVAVTFGTLLGLLPFSYAVFALALPYIFFSTIVVLHPNERRSVVSFFLISAFRSFSVSNSDTSLANSSSMAGTSFTLTSLTFTWNTTGLPASSGV